MVSVYILFLQRRQPPRYKRTDTLLPNTTLFRSLEDIRAASEATNANRPKGAMEGDGKHYQIYTATSGRNLDDYQRLVIAWRNGAPIRLGDVAEITDGPQDQNGRASWRDSGCKYV